MHTISLLCTIPNAQNYFTHMLRYINFQSERLRLEKKQEWVRNMRITLTRSFWRAFVAIAMFMYYRWVWFANHRSHTMQIQWKLCFLFSVFQSHPTGFNILGKVKFITTCANISINNLLVILWVRASWYLYQTWRASATFEWTNTRFTHLCFLYLFIWL